jgi:hypothetical protein
MSQQEEHVLSLEDSGSECFDTAEAGLRLPSGLPLYRSLLGLTNKGLPLTAL